MSIDVDAQCPRCGGGFRCGAKDAEPCACTALKLDAATLADLRQRYQGCLCLKCLHEISLSIPKAQATR